MPRSLGSVITMTDHPHDVLNQISTTTEAVANLRTLFAAEEPLDDVLHRVARTAVDATAHANAVSITVLGTEAPRTAAYTDPRILELDDRQYTSGRGPCLEAAQRREPVRVAMNVEPQRWPEFVDAARTRGVHASLSLPLLIDSVGKAPELVGSVNVYSYTATAFDPYDEELMMLFTTAASHAITNARRWQHTRTTLDQLERALSSRSDIDQAKGALRAVHGYTADDAFTALVEQSQNRNMKLRSVAREFLDTLAVPAPNDNDDHAEPPPR